MFRTVVSVMAGLFLASGTAHAQEPLAGLAQPLASAANLKLESQATLDLRGPLTLEDVLRLVERNHPKVRGAEVNRRIAAAKFLEKQGAFDPVFNAASEYLEYNSTTSPGQERTAFQNYAQVDFLTPSGIKYAFGGRLNTGSVKQPLSATGSTGEYFVTLALPLFRALGINDKSAALQQAEVGLPIADADFAETRLELLEKSAQTYWDWVAAGRKIQINRDLLKLAADRAEAIRERADAGDLPAIDSVEANQEVRLREGELIRSERDFQRKSFDLSLYLWREDGINYAPPPAERVPTTLSEPAKLDANLVSEGQLSAINRRPELRRLALNRDLARIDLALAQNRRLPQVDLYVSPGIDTGINAVQSPTLKLGVEISLPLAQRTADGLIDQARLKIDKIDLDTLNERQRILTQVSDAVSAMEAAYQRYLVASQEVALARRLEQGERDRFALGDSTVFLVNQRERATASALAKQIDAQAEYERAAITYRAIVGRL